MSYTYYVYCFFLRVIGKYFLLSGYKIKAKTLKKQTFYQKNNVNAYDLSLY